MSRFTRNRIKARQQRAEQYRRIGHFYDLLVKKLERLRKHCHPVRHWFYGHYHHSWQADFDGIRYTMLKEMEMKELR